jgi:hypothetical protein
MIGVAPYTPPLLLIFELILTFPVSILFAGPVNFLRGNLQFWYPIIIITVLNNINIPLHLGENKVLVALLILIMLILSRFVYIIAKENFIRIYTEMEL